MLSYVLVNCKLELSQHVVDGILLAGTQRIRRQLGLATAARKAKQRKKVEGVDKAWIRGGTPESHAGSVGGDCGNRRNSGRELAGTG